DPAEATLLFALGTVAYIAAVGNSLDVGENYRFRFLGEPLFVVLCGLTLRGIIPHIRDRGASPPSPV
ncbi:MAG: hypothetical protein QGH59_00355, partial [Gemmatimonadota bacterium]|nr:hypothetical protein [Gemmatimonadota bacterium]